MKFPILAGLALASFSTLATAGQFYIGAGAELAGSGEEEYTVGSLSATVDYDYTAQSIRLGYQQDNNNRFEVSLNNIDIEYTDGGDEETYTGLDLDYYFVWGEKVKPYLMLGLGFYNYEDTAQYFVDDEDLSGVAFNLAGGVIWQFYEHMDVQVGYKVKAISWADATDGVNTYETSSTHSGVDMAVHFLF